MISPRQRFRFRATRDMPVPLSTMTSAIRSLVRLARFLVVALPLCACASTQMYATDGISPVGAAASPASNPPEGKARIVMLRKGAMLGAAIGFEITDTSKPVGKIGPGGVLAWDREPGEIVIGAAASNHPNLTLAASAGSTYFVEIWSQWGSLFTTATCEMRLLSADEGRKLLDQIRPASGR